MKILSGTSMKNGSIIHGECAMVDRYGNVYQCIDNAYHPNPGTAADGYSEIERTVDWLYANNFIVVRKDLALWVGCRVAVIVANCNDAPPSYDEVIKDVMYSDLYDPCEATKAAILNILEQCVRDSRILEQYLSINELDVSARIASFLNENFMRVRAGGKLNPSGTNSIYFRISSHGFNWNPIIIDFLWNSFGDTSKMPEYVWVGHDAETNPPEIVLFEGTPSDLFDKYDYKILASNEIVWM